jgi:hypothetical protein
VRRRAQALTDDEGWDLQWSQLLAIKLPQCVVTPFAVLCCAASCSALEKFCAQHQQWLQDGMCLLVEYRQRDLELILVPVWVQQPGE